MNKDRIEFLEVVREVDPKNLSCLIELGWLYELIDHDFDRATCTLGYATEIEPQSVEALYWLAIVHYHDRCNFEKAKGLLEKALKVEPFHAAASSLYGSVCGDLDLPAQAIPSLEGAIARESTWPSLFESLDWAYTEIGELGKAIECAKQSFRLQKRYLEVSTEENYSYYEACVTSRWTNKESLRCTRWRAARKA